MIKKMITILILIASNQAYGINGGDHVLKCEEDSFASVWLYLDEARLSATSENFRVLGATIVYNYSATISMSCDDNYYKKDSSEVINCTGYYYSGDLTTLKIFPEGGKVYAEWQTSKPYGQQRFKTQCQLVETN